jgi:hypothetical protein
MTARPQLNETGREIRQPLVHFFQVTIQLPSLESVKLGCDVSSEAFAIQSGQCHIIMNKRGQFNGSGVDVMITIFCNFSQFSAKKLAFFLNTNVMINCFQNLALF